MIPNIAEDFDGVDILITSEDKKSYRVTDEGPSAARLGKLWEYIQAHHVLYSDFTEGDFGAFVDYFLSPAVFILWVFKGDEPVGLIYADEIRVGASAKGHFIFEDRKLSGRRRLVMTAFHEIMDIFDLQRVEAEVPVDAHWAISFCTRLGLYAEGRRRRRVLRKGNWKDTFIFSALIDELDAEALQHGKIRRTEGEKKVLKAIEESGLRLIRTRVEGGEL